MEKVFSEVDKLNEKYIGFLKDVATLESPTGFKEGVDACGKYFIDRAKELGFSVEVEKMERSGDAVCITMNENAAGVPISISGHIDTVHPVGLFGEEPVKIEGDIMHGPGVGDCKGGVVAGFMAMEALKNIGFKDRPVKLILQTDEENSSETSNKATVRFICEKAKDSVAMLNVEPSNRNSDVVIERKGIAKYKIVIKGVAAHASICFKDTAASAIAEAAHKILKIEKFKDKEGITANVGLINGGTAVNTVPAECVLMVDTRYKTDEQLKEIETFMENLSKESTIKGTTTEITRINLRLSMPKVERNISLMKKVNDILLKAGLEELKEKVTFGGSDAADYTHFGIPVLDQLGIICEGAHTINERVDLKSLPYCAKRVAAIVMNL